MNVYQADLNGNNVKALTSFKGEPVRFLSISKNGTMAFGYAGELYTLNAKGKPNKLKVSIVHDNNEPDILKLNFRSGMNSVAIDPSG